MQPLIGGGGSLVNNNNNNNTSLANNNNIAVSKTGLYHGKKCCEVLFVEIIHGFLSLSLSLFQTSSQRNQYYIACKMKRENRPFLKSIEIFVIFPTLIVVL